MKQKYISTQWAKRVRISSKYVKATRIRTIVGDTWLSAACHSSIHLESAMHVGIANTLCCKYPNKVNNQSGYHMLYTEEKVQYKSTYVIHWSNCNICKASWGLCVYSYYLISCRNPTTREVKYRKAPLHYVRDQLTLCYKLSCTFNKQVVSPLLELPLQPLDTNYNVSIRVSA